jgi:hypothetical protein
VASDGATPLSCAGGRAKVGLRAFFPRPTAVSRGCQGLAPCPSATRTPRRCRAIRACPQVLRTLGGMTEGLWPSVGDDAFITCHAGLLKGVLGANKGHDSARTAPFHAVAAVSGDLTADAGVHEPVSGAGECGAGAACELAEHAGADAAEADSKHAEAHPDHQAHAVPGGAEPDVLRGEHDADLL